MTRRIESLRLADGLKIVCEPSFILRRLAELLLEIGVGLIALPRGRVGDVV